MITAGDMVYIEDQNSSREESESKTAAHKMFTKNAAIPYREQSPAQDATAGTKTHVFDKVVDFYDAGNLFRVRWNAH